MSIDPCGFWQAKKARARHQVEKEILRLNEMMEREQMLMDQLFAPQQGCAVAVSTARGAVPATPPGLPAEGAVLAVAMVAEVAVEVAMGMGAETSLAIARHQSLPGRPCQ